MAGFGGKVVLVTGGTSGIGEATAVAFAKQGAKVVVSGRREKEGLAVVETIKSAGGTGHFVRAGVTANAAHPRWVKTDMRIPAAPMDIPDGAKTSVRLAALPADGPTGGFFHGDERLPW
jgi:NAD(P)-dependent dehydrogenase (short-subunit alcohol dehydrogenase family)